MITPSLDQYDIAPTDDPTLLADPLKQQKLAENVLTQLGLHPNQQGAKSLLDAHFSGPTASPEVTEAAKPLIENAAAATPPQKDSREWAKDYKVPPDSGIETPLASARPAAVPPTPPAAPEAAATPPLNSVPPPGPISNTPEPAKPAASGSTLPTIPPPSGGTPSLIAGNANKSTGQAQGELQRLINTGSGTSQIKNPFLRGLAHVGEIAGDIVTPNLVKDIPGTEEHHNMLIRQQEGLIGQNEKTAQSEATIAHTNEETQTGEDTVKELNLWIQQNPGKPITEYWRDKATASMGKLTPQQQVMRYLTLPAEEGGMNLPPDEAFKRTQGIISDTKPKTAAQVTSAFQDLMSKMSGGQQLDPKLMSDPPSLVGAIATSMNLSPEEKQNAFAYLISHNTPASGAYAANTRAETMKSMRLFPAINSQGQPVFVTPDMVKSDPNAYMPGTLGEHAMSKGQAFADIDFNMKNVESALKGLKNGFDATTSAQLAFALRSSDPHNALSTFLTSRAGTALQPDQIDLVTALASLNENALALRGIQGLGQGSDELRAAITRMIPGAGTPSTDYAARQMELLKGTVERARMGIPKSIVNNPALPAAKTTQELHDENNPPAGGEKGKTVSRADVETEVKRLNDANKDKPGWKELTIEDAIADAKKHNITVK